MAKKGRKKAGRKTRAKATRKRGRGRPPNKGPTIYRIKYYRGKRTYLGKAKA